ncbi:MAG: DUF6879 family protein [Pseudonocardia sp.]
MIELDYWIVADPYVVPMIYDADGRFVGAEVLPADRVAEFIRDRDRAWATACRRRRTASPV